VRIEIDITADELAAVLLQLRGIAPPAAPPSGAPDDDSHADGPKLTSADRDVLTALLELRIAGQLEPTWETAIARAGYSSIKPTRLRDRGYIETGSGPGTGIKLTAAGLAAAKQLTE
jgi:hypothetical protein